MAGEVSIASAHVHLRYSTFRLPGAVVIQTFITADSVSKVRTGFYNRDEKCLVRSLLLVFKELNPVTVVFRC
jgi:hypothetical protein